LAEGVVIVEGTDVEGRTNQAVAYAELHCCSNFTFLRGASHPEELVRQAAALGYQALAITDECSLAGVVRAHVAARQAGLQLLVGSEFHSEEGPRFLMLAPDRRAYGQLSCLITRARRRCTKGRYQLSVGDLHDTSEQCLFVWLPSLDSCRSLGSADREFLNQMQQSVVSQRLWIGLQQNLNHGDDDLYRQRLALAERLDLPVVACGKVQMHVAARKPLLDIVTAIRLNTQVDSAGFALHGNREAHLRPYPQLCQHFCQQALDATVDIARRCDFSLDELRYEYPRELVPPGQDPATYLRSLVVYGASQRWPTGTPPTVLALLDKELRLIGELQYEYYFLTVYDVVQFARSQQILCQGRGSAANSAVCFCLFITEVDPAKSNLLFERFISKERNEPPDIDVDFEHERREEVIQFIYRKYGRQRAALAATVITYRLKSALRDVGRAMGMDQALLDQLGRVRHCWDDPQVLPGQLQTLGIDSNNPQIRRLKYLVDTLLGFPRHLSQHVGGFIVSAGPLDQLVPIENAAMAQRTVIQWDKDDIEALGLLKIDVLALGMLSAIRKAFTLIESLRGQRWSMATLPQEDAETYAMLQRGDSVGVFQVESRAQMAMLPRLKPACFYDLVIEVAIVRPGPIQGNMVHPYLKRRQGLESVDYACDEVKAVLERTLGVPIFQEQVIQLAMVAAGFNAGEADQLRRAMASWKRKGELQRYQEKLMAGLLARGHAPEFASRLIEQINGFGEYGFPESHSASFALLVYVSAWLKCHEPAVFCCALLNSQPMGFYSPSQLVQDVRRHRIDVKPVDVMVSDWDHALESDGSQENVPPSPQVPHLPQPAIRLGLRLVKGLSRKAGERITACRRERAFLSLADVVQRAQLHNKDVDALAHANALVSLAGHRFQARWAAQGIDTVSPYNTRPLDTELPLNTVLPLFSQEHFQETPVVLPAPSQAQDLVEDYQSLKLTLGKHPLALLRSHPQLKGCKRHRELQQLGHKRFVRIAGMVTGRQRPGSAAGVVFITLEDETGNSNIVVFKDVVTRQRAIVVHARLLLVKGVVEREGEVIHVIAGQLEDLTPLLGELETYSRDFH
jgi:error-prone DNA polymerase